MFHSLCTECERLARTKPILGPHDHLRIPKKHFGDAVECEVCNALWMLLDCGWVRVLADQQPPPPGGPHIELGVGRPG
jgi:hypothetical protein